MTGGTEGAGRRKMLEGVDDLEDGGKKEGGGAAVRQNRWQ